MAQKRPPSEQGGVRFIYNSVARIADDITQAERSYIRSRVFTIREGALTPAIRGHVNFAVLKSPALHGAVFLHRVTKEDFDLGRPGRRVGLVAEFNDENGVMAFTQPDLSSNIAFRDKLTAEARLRNFAVNDARSLDEQADAVFHPVIGDEFGTASYLRFMGFAPARARVPSGLSRQLREIAPSLEVRWLVKDLRDRQLLRREQQEADRLAWEREAAERQAAEAAEQRAKLERKAEQMRLKHELKPAVAVSRSRTRLRFGYEKLPPADNPGARGVFVGLALDFSEGSAEIKDRAANVRSLRKR